jgi:predicted ATPase
LMLTRLAISGYRSLRSLAIDLARINVVCGANGVGKSSLYRSIRLLAEIAQGGAIRALAREGGLNSTLWAGPEAFSRDVKRGIHSVQGLSGRKGPVALKLGFASDLWGYAVDLGLPVGDGGSAFAFDPAIKAESMWTGDQLTQASVFAERRGPSVRIRDREGGWRQVSATLPPFDSMLTHCADPSEAPDLLLMRDHMRNWRFYDHFRTDADAPARRPQIGTRTPVLASDGSDLAAALQTILEIGDAAALNGAVGQAFPGAAVEIDIEGGLFRTAMRQHGLLRPLSAAELSDGTLRYLLLIAALLTPRPPQLMVLNEPETSLHPDLLAPLARLIEAGGETMQIIVVTHSAKLADALGGSPHCETIRLTKELGETRRKAARRRPGAGPNAEARDTNHPRDRSPPLSWSCNKEQVNRVDAHELSGNPAMRGMVLGADAMTNELARRREVAARGDRSGKPWIEISRIAPPTPWRELSPAPIASSSAASARWDANARPCSRNSAPMWWASTWRRRRAGRPIPSTKSSSAIVLATTFSGARASRIAARSCWSPPTSAPISPPPSRCG